MGLLTAPLRPADDLDEKVGVDTFVGMPVKASGHTIGTIDSAYIADGWVMLNISIPDPE